MANYSNIKLKFSVIESGTMKNQNIQCENELSGARIIKMNVSNSFHTDMNVISKNISLIPKTNQNYIELIVVTAAINSDESIKIRNAALRSLPIYCQIYLDKTTDKNSVTGLFFIISYSVNNNEFGVPEISFKLHSTGEYYYDTNS